jgi:hypothetical protein
MLGTTRYGEISVLLLFESYFRYLSHASDAPFAAITCVFCVF